MENTQSENGKENVTRFEVTVQHIPYQIEVSPIECNNETRFGVTVNAGPQDTFAWDNEVKMYQGLDDKSAILPDGLMIEINRILLDLKR